MYIYTYMYVYTHTYAYILLLRADLEKCYMLRLMLAAVCDMITVSAAVLVPQALGEERGNKRRSVAMNSFRPGNGKSPAIDLDGVVIYIYIYIDIYIYAGFHKWRYPKWLVYKGKSH